MMDPVVLMVEKFQYSEPDETVDEGVIVTLSLSQADVAALLAEYDPSSSTSPSATICRAIARPIATAIAAEVVEAE